MSELNDAEFKGFQRLVHSVAGISLADSKRALITGRLRRRLGESGAHTFGEYLKLITSGSKPEELQTAVDLLTTNETYFFREPKHFEFLRAQLRLPPTAPSRGPMRIWSAASSSGEEAYSIAMVMEDLRPARWEVMGSDISLRILEKARAARYSTERLTNLPAAYRQRFCTMGTGEDAGTLEITPALRSRVTFKQVNLNHKLPNLGIFDGIFLRNVLIYFNADTRRQVLERVLACLRPGGFLLIGHSDSLVGMNLPVQALAPAIFRKPL